jgi:hypothetical protein
MTCASSAQDVKGNVVERLTLVIRVRQRGEFGGATAIFGDGSERRRRGLQQSKAGLAESFGISLPASSAMSHLIDDSLSGR